MISVITPVYNGERFIEACIKVVIEQNCPDVEHIILDGGSTDGTVEIIQQYAEKYSHIRWISEKDKGQSDAMNKGIAMAKGEILAILNVDDYYEPNTLNRVLEIFISLPEPTLLVGNCNILDDHGNLLLLNKPTQLSLFNLVLTTPLGSPINHYPCNPSAYFYHTSLHKKIGLYEVDDHYSMDLDFILRAVQVASVKYINETWGNFRLIEGTKTLNDIKNDNLNKRTITLSNKYKKQLSFLQLIHLNIRYLLMFMQLKYLKPYLKIKIKNINIIKQYVN